jgi:hypothetical protein
MKPISPVIAGVPEVIFAKDQPEYLPLPAVKCDDGTVLSRWKLTWVERWQIFIHGNLWLCQLTFNQPLQPQRPSVYPPSVRMGKGNI